MCTIGIFHGDDFFVVVQVMEQWREDLPARVELVITDEVRVVTLEGVEDQRFIGFRDFEIREAPTIGKI